MKTTFIILLILVVCFIIYWHHPRFKAHGLHRAILTTFGIDPDGGQYFYRSIKWLGFLLRFNAFPYELNLDQMGIYLIRRPWHGFKKNKFFYPLYMVKMVNTTEYFGRIAKINVFIDYNGQNTQLSIPRFFSVQDAQQFHRKWTLSLMTGTIN
ncbi:hypothetical protein G7092_26500 [Mucilaginibacter sp. HC2]|uniref:hypothetical protein n=1 Tax=Mucilaginibacter inviolabilis TaxID=2714892 RepID=UPI0014088C16|nr:hypothetical protein [Mucilaginibacter inviolabilis]NHA07378.1 hypothetical protein [Mucilaginibacter inviolabilis]